MAICRHQECMRKATGNGFCSTHLDQGVPPCPTCGAVGRYQRPRAHGTHGDRPVRGYRGDGLGIEVSRTIRALRTILGAREGEDILEIASRRMHALESLANMMSVGHES